MKYWAALDGLRGIAVIAVVLFHAQTPFLRGGFIGVDIFFVLSGFLITCQLLNEMLLFGRVNWVDFFKRRLVRLQPALLLLLLGYTLAWTVGWIPTPLTITVTDILTVLFAFANWARAFEWSAPDYLGHTWSLGIEEQFYLLWAALLANLGSKLLQPWRLAILAILGALASSMWIYWLCDIGATPSRMYNGLDTRAMGLLWGCALAGFFHSRYPYLLEARGALARHILISQQNRSAQILSIVGGISFVLLIVAVVLAEWKQAYMFKWGYTGVAILTCIAVGSLIACPKGFLNYILEFSLLVNVGKISYGLYLWHYPVIRIFEAYRNTIGISQLTAMAAALAISLFVAIGSYFWLEQPLKRLMLKNNNYNHPG